MNLIKYDRTEVSEQSETEFIALVKPTAKVSFGLAVMLLLTGGKPPTWMVGLGLLLSIAYISWRQKNRIVSPQQRLAITSDFAGANLKAADLKNADMRNVDLRSANLSRADLSNGDLRDANLRSADLSDANLSKANLRDANLRAAYLRGVNLNEANLSRADLNSANLKGANLSNANLIDADLRGTNLKSANLNCANLTGADLSRAYVKNTRFSNNIGLSEEIQRDLKQRGAIFEDCSCDRAEVLTGV
jgi:uncharacterized protein YjbI with pentapeptide repeats